MLKTALYNWRGEVNWRQYSSFEKHLCRMWAAYCGVPSEKLNNELFSFKKYYKPGSVLYKCWNRFDALILTLLLLDNIHALSQVIGRAASCVKHGIKSLGTWLLQSYTIFLKGLEIGVFLKLYYWGQKLEAGKGRWFIAFTFFASALF